MTFKLFPLDKPELFKRMGIGALIGLTVILFFLTGADDPQPEWGANWMIRPLIIVPIAASIGASFNYFVSTLNLQSDWAKLAGIGMSLFVFLVSLWMGIVLGLDGTYWN